MIKKLTLFLLLTTILYCHADEEPLTIPLEYGPATEMLAESENLDKFWTLFRYFDSQITPTFCGVASATMILNALDVSDPKNNPPSTRYGTQEQRFFTEAVSEIIDIEAVRKGGLALGELEVALKTFEIEVQAYHASDVDIDTFRLMMQNAFAEPRTYIIVNYNRQELGQKGSGHHSPIGAYNSKEDRVLILDVNRRYLPSVWVKTEVLFNAMKSVDSSSGISRGFIIISN